MSSANIMQACVARNVGKSDAQVITYAKNLRHVTPPYITQGLLKESTNMSGAERKSLRLGTMDYYIHVLSAKGVYFLCLTEGSEISNAAATYGFLDQVSKNFDPSQYTEGDESKQDSAMRRLIGASFFSFLTLFAPRSHTHSLTQLLTYLLDSLTHTHFSQVE